MEPLISHCVRICSISTLCLLFTGIFGDVSADRRIVEEKPAEIGYVLSVYGATDRQKVLIQDRGSLRIPLYILSAEGHPIARFEPEPPLDQQLSKTKPSGACVLEGRVIALRDGQRQKPSPIRMGLPVVIRKPVVRWIYEPERRKEPFVRKELIRSYPPTRMLATDKREMVLIPKGRTIIGSNTGYANEYPEHIVYLDDFYIDKYEVSHRDLRRYLQSSGDKKYMDMLGEVPDDTRALIRASYELAERYCRWAGKELPREEQWEKAARGSGIVREKDSDGIWITFRRPIIYPWGNTFDPERCNCESIAGSSVAVTSYREGVSPYGVYNMAGNAMEWTQSWYLPYPGSRIDDPNFGHVFRVLRGGDFASRHPDVRASRRIPGGIPSTDRDMRGGIRCVYNVKRTDSRGP